MCDNLGDITDPMLKSSNKPPQIGQVKSPANLETLESASQRLRRHLKILVHFNFVTCFALGKLA